MVKSDSTKAPRSSISKSFDDNVFINCPFDRQYKPIFDAIVFAIHDAGFVACCALEAIDSGQNRLDKILEIIADCKYGIHDISRTERGKTDLPRFNMPFECGIFWGCLEFGKGKQQQKRLLVLDREEFRYRESISDIAGQDIKYHNDDPRLAIDRVRSWLNIKSGRRTIPGGKAIWNRYKIFRDELSIMSRAMGITRTELSTPEYYPDYVSCVVTWITESEEEAKNKPSSRRLPTRP